MSVVLGQESQATCPQQILRLVMDERGRLEVPDDRIDVGFAEDQVQVGTRSRVVVVVRLALPVLRRRRGLPFCHRRLLRHPRTIALRRTIAPRGLARSFRPYTAGLRFRYTKKTGPMVPPTWT